MMGLPKGWSLLLVWALWCMLRRASAKVPERSRCLMPRHWALRVILLWQLMAFWWSMRVTSRLVLLTLQHSMMIWPWEVR